MRRKRLVSVLLVVGAVLLLGGFAAAQAIYIPVISKGFQHQFWQAVRLGAEKAARDYKVVITFEGPENESMVDKQLDMLQTDLAKNPSAICFAALDSKAAIPLLQEAKKRKIPIIGFDSGVDSDIPVTTAATDNIAAAALAADKMAALIGGTSLSGGEGTILGTVIGAFVMSVLVNGLRILSVPQEWQTVMTGVIVIFAVYADILRRKRA